MALDATDSKQREPTVRISTLLNKLLNLQGLRVMGVRFEDGDMIVSVHRTFRQLTCPCCGQRERGRESKRVRRWRHMAIWGNEVYIEGEIRRLKCKKCQAVVTETVPWARHNSDFTRPFEDAVALLAQQTNKTAVGQLTGIAWPTVGAIAGRVVAEKLDPARFEDLRRIAVDEISFRKRHRYLTVVTDHDRRRVIWVAEGKSAEVLERFFQLIGREACERITIVTMDMSAAYEKAVREKLPNAEIVFDHFHIAQLANKALNEVRRALVRDAVDEDAKKQIKGTMWPTLHRMDNATATHLEALAQLRPTEPLGRAYLLKESLLDILGLDVPHSEPALNDWMAWAARSRLQPFVRLGRTIRDHLSGVVALFKERIANGIAEGMNNKIRLLSHRAFGFHSASPLIATIYLCCGGITLPNLQLV
jgi:transposase